MRLSFYRCSRLALVLAVFPVAAQAQTGRSDVQPSTDTLVPPPANLREMANVSLEQTEANITGLVPRLLEGLQYSRHPFDAEISGKFLDRYLDELDHWHLYFLQSDLQQFEVYSNNLQNLTLRLHDFSPSAVIFSRFIQRASERVAYATNLLHTETFQFTNQERFIPNRHTLPYPANLDEARQLWRQELRFELLDEKLKAPDMAISGPASFDAQSNVVILLPLQYTNSVSTTASPATPNRTVESLLPFQFLDQEHHAFGSVTPTPSNVIVRLQIPPKETLRKITNNFYSEDGQRLGGIRFVHPADTAAATNNALSSADANPLISIRVPNPAHSASETNNPAPAETNAEATLRGVVELNRKDAEEIVKTLTKRYIGLLKNYNDLTNDDYVLEVLPDGAGPRLRSAFRLHGARQHREFQHSNEALPFRHRRALERGGRRLQD